MTKKELNEVIREIREETNERCLENPDTHMVLTAKTAIAVLKDVYEGVQ